MHWKRKALCATHFLYIRVLIYYCNTICTAVNTSEKSHTNNQVFFRYIWKANHGFLIPSKMLLYYSYVLEKWLVHFQTLIIVMWGVTTLFQHMGNFFPYQDSSRATSSLCFPTWFQQSKHCIHTFLILTKHFS